MKRKYLYAIAGLIWGIPGIIITSNIFPASVCLYRFVLYRSGPDASSVLRKIFA